MPACITWMTRRMWNDLVRFGDVLFLDAQKRQYNEEGFPYCAFTMVDYENTVAIGSDTIYTEESHVGYIQMIQNTQ